MNIRPESTTTIWVSCGRASACSSAPVNTLSVPVSSRTKLAHVFSGHCCEDFLGSYSKWGSLCCIDRVNKCICSSVTCSSCWSLLLFHLVCSPPSFWGNLRKGGEWWLFRGLSLCLQLSMSYPPALQGKVTGKKQNNTLNMMWCQGEYNEVEDQPVWRMTSKALIQGGKVFAVQ